MAGQESSSSTLIWALKYLTNHQSTQRKLRQALRAAHGAALAEGRLPTAGEIVRAQVPFLDAVMDECLRLGTPIPFLARDAEVDTEILGVRIPKGTTVFAHALGPGMAGPALAGIDPGLRFPTAQGARTGRWADDDDVARFRPERWLVEAGRDPRTGEEPAAAAAAAPAYDPNAGPFMAFGLGPRACFGRRMGLFEFRTSLTLLVWHFEFLEVPPSLAGYEARDGLTRRPKMPFIKPRCIKY